MPNVNVRLFGSEVSVYGGAFFFVSECHVQIHLKIFAKISTKTYKILKVM